MSVFQPWRQRACWPSALEAREAYLTVRVGEAREAGVEKEGRDSAQSGGRGVRRLMLWRLRLYYRSTWMPRHIRGRQLRKHNEKTRITRSHCRRPSAGTAHLRCRLLCMEYRNRHL